MKKYRLLLHMLLAKQRGSFFGIGLLMFFTSLCLFTSLTLLTSGRSFISAEMDRLGFGEFTAWINADADATAAEIKKIDDVEKVIVQPLIFSGYQIGGVYSDNEGQLIVGDGSIPYQFIDCRGKVVNLPVIRSGEIYISPAMQSTYQIDIGDLVMFELSRQNGVMKFTVAGYFADGFMGSSMIDMKSFLICKEDFQEAITVMQQAKDYDLLAEQGAMLHVFKKTESTLSNREFQMQIQERTDLSLHTKFSYQKASILSFMLLLQNILSNFLLAFSLILLIVCMVVISHNLSAAFERDRKDIAILKVLGLTGSKLRLIYLVLHGGIVIICLLLGLCLTIPLSTRIAREMVSSTGMMIEILLPGKMICFVFAGLLLGMSLFLFVKTSRVMQIRPMLTIRDIAYGESAKEITKLPIVKNRLAMSLAVRSLQFHKRKYIGLLLISLFLTFFLSVLGAMVHWLGPNGEGLMNAFSVADHDIGVQPFNETVPMDEIERVINWYSQVRNQYELAMESVTVNGTQYTANILNDTSYFHILRGQVCKGDEVVITDVVAAEQGLDIGDEVAIIANGRSHTYTVSGVYLCANGMGTNIGLSIEGYSHIGNITGFIWCYHYVLENGTVREYVRDYLQEHYSGIDVHTNSWSGLDGIVRLMKALAVIIYAITAMFILVVVLLVSSMLFGFETADIMIYKSMGVSTMILRHSFSLRFLLVVLVGSVLGAVVGFLSAENLVGRIFQMIGIGEFLVPFSLLGTILPPITVTLLFYVFAFLLSGRIGRTDIMRLISEYES